MKKPHQLDRAKRSDQTAIKSIARPSCPRGQRFSPPALWLETLHELGALR